MSSTEKNCIECGGYLNDKCCDVCFKCWHLANLGAIKQEALASIKEGKAMNWLKALNKDITNSTYRRFKNFINEKAANAVTMQKAA